MPGSRVTVIDIVSTPSEDQARYAADIITKLAAQVLMTVNEWGIDNKGILAEYCDKNKIIHINWSVDDPFYEEIIHTKKFRPCRLRFDFVSDKGYVGSMRKKGYNAFFLPLAVDTSIFNAAESEGVKTYENDIVFVGNSYLRQMDDFLKTAPDFIDTIATFLPEAVDRYYEDVQYDMESWIETKLKNMKLPDNLTAEKALFIAKHAAGYFVRRQLIVSLAEKYPGFKVFGEKGWLKDLPPSRLAKVGYYDGLCKVYRSARINIDINRMVIRNGFTQRVFDVPASGGFLITSAKPVIDEYFETSGPNREMAVFRSRRELWELIEYYLSHDDERIAVAQRGMRKVLASHTYDHRMAEMFGVISRELKMRP